MMITKIEIGGVVETGCGVNFTRSFTGVVLSTEAGPVASIRKIRPTRLVPQLQNLGLSLAEIDTLFADRIVTGSWEF